MYVWHGLAGWLTDWSRLLKNREGSSVSRGLHLRTEAIQSNLSINVRAHVPVQGQHQARFNIEAELPD